MRCQGRAYLDCNEGDGPVERAFREWNWSYTVMAGGSTAVIDDVKPLLGADRVIAQRFTPNGGSAA